MARPYYKKDDLVWVKYLKYTVVSLVLLVFFFTIFIIFSPAGKHKAENELNKQYDQYSLKPQFNQENVEKLLVKLKQDREFGFYFYALKPEQISRCVNEIYPLLDQNRDKEKLFQLIQDQKQKVQNISQLFNHLEYSESYIKNPRGYPELDQILWEFLQEEFKLTFIGIIYKANFNREFIFIWNEQEEISADKLRRIIFSQKNLEEPQKS